MRSYSLSFIFFLSAFTLFAVQENPSVNEIRDLYLIAGENSKFRQQFIDYFIEKPPVLPVEQAYFATAILMSSEIQQGKINQYLTFKKGKQMLDSVIAHHENIAEIRYLRFAVQENIPGFLNYDNRDEDKAILFNNLNSIQNMNHLALKNAVKNTLLNSNHLSISEKEKIKHLNLEDS